MAASRNTTSEFHQTESEVRFYCRSAPSVFVRAKNARVWCEEGVEFIDFLSACGSLNYGHNHPAIKERVVAYLAADGMLNGLDLHTAAKRDFLQNFRQVILEPRGLSYRVQFTGPTGTNAVEAALKLARKVTGRRSVVAFTNAFHGMTLGALSISGNQRGASVGPAAGEVVRLPFDGYQGAGIRDLVRYETMVSDPSGGLARPAAFIVETVQGEGGLNVASVLWLQHLAALATRLGALLIVDDIQAGCGRTEGFFSFERAGIKPDLVCLSKSLSGIGLPMALLLIKPEYDHWAPGEHNGTFRGNNLAFVAATTALEFWRDADFRESLASKTARIREWMSEVVEKHGPEMVESKGLGMMSGLSFAERDVAGLVAREAYRKQVLIETAGPYSEVLKLMPPLTIEKGLLEEALGRLRDAIDVVLARKVIKILSAA